MLPQHILAGIPAHPTLRIALSSLASLCLLTVLLRNCTQNGIHRLMDVLRTASFIEVFILKFMSVVYAEDIKVHIRHLPPVLGSYYRLSTFRTDYKHMRSASQYHIDSGIRGVGFVGG
ncbi:hypothetical protein P691DRAFT_260161 [Macrolepiota fuliginosa MF-IS2]|uniref:Uncharacterized protein n=1 Tax=Macrolepiota fuliginosa MF-IS2 TaxID=1400762 RepID=A0A9P5XAA7_9AGAR|nr:hypothetical protein P691DRAFT_260161 [Macrolepiota fuliginosa MF-IS2]